MDRWPNNLADGPFYNILMDRMIIKCCLFGITDFENGQVLFLTL